MIRLRIEEILNEKEKSLYWLRRQMKMSDQNLNRLIQNRTLSIKYRILERFCRVLDCSPGELFTIEYEETIAAGSLPNKNTSAKSGN